MRSIEQIRHSFCQPFSVPPKLIRFGGCENTTNVCESCSDFLSVLWRSSTSPREFGRQTFALPISVSKSYPAGRGESQQYLLVDDARREDRLSGHGPKRSALGHHVFAAWRRHPR